MKKSILTLIISIIFFSVIGIFYSFMLGFNLKQDAEILKDSVIDLTKESTYRFSFTKRTLSNTGFYIRVNFPDFFLDPSSANAQYVEKRERDRRNKRYYEDQLTKAKNDKEKLSIAKVIEKLNKSIEEYEKNTDQQIIRLRELYGQRYERLNDFTGYLTDNLRIKVILKNAGGQTIFERIIPSNQTTEVKGYPFQPYAPKTPPFGMGSAYIDLHLGWLYPDKLQKYTLQVEVLNPVSSIASKAASLLIHYAPKEILLKHSFFYSISVFGLILGICSLLVYLSFTFIYRKVNKKPCY